MISPESRERFFSHSTGLKQVAFLSLFIVIIFLSSPATSDFDHCQELINEQGGHVLWEGNPYDSFTVVTSVCILL